MIMEDSQEFLNKLNKTWNDDLVDHYTQLNNKKPLDITNFTSFLNPRDKMFLTVVANTSHNIKR